MWGPAIWGPAIWGPAGGAQIADQAQTIGQRQRAKMTTAAAATEDAAQSPDLLHSPGVPYYRIVNAAFTHAHPLGSRFNDPDRGAWYAAFELETAQAEIHVPQDHRIRRNRAFR